MKNKKALKDFVNQNGFFVQINDVREVEKNEASLGRKDSIKTKAKLPDGENILVFKGLASQDFGLGEESRNGYKIDVNGWDWSNYINNPVILLQHNDDAPIGKTLEISKTDKGVEILYFVNLNAMSKEDAERVRSGIISGLSTGHITKAVAFENSQTGERITEEEFYALGSQDQALYNYVVTEAEAIEISMVSLPSNPEALTTQNSLKFYFNNRIKMNLKKNQSEADEAKEVQAPAEDQAEETNEEVIEEEAKKENESDDDKSESEEEKAEKEGETPEESDEEKAENDAESEDDADDAEPAKDEETPAQNFITEEDFVQAVSVLNGTLNDLISRLEKLEGKNKTKAVKKSLVVVGNAIKLDEKSDDKVEPEANKRSKNSWISGKLNLKK
jgi:hypothetical protein